MGFVPLVSFKTVFMLLGLNVRILGCPVKLKVREQSSVGKGKKCYHVI
jgi:hypothetical protein